MLGDRQYQLHVPSGLSAAQVPLLVSLHGAGSNGAQDEYFTGWSQFADAHGFIVAYPDATFPDEPGLPYLDGGAWDPYTDASTDISFLRQVVRDISSTYCVDPSRVYVDGWSNGAVMSQRAACDLPDLFAAADSYAGGDPTVWDQSSASAGQYSGEPCQPSRPISVALVVGQEDFTYGGLSQNASLWQRIDGCATTPVAETDSYGSSETYACSQGAQLLTRVVSNTSHNWPSGPQGEDQRERIWGFFTTHPLP
jgi:polyhydroxybutyrate depolymerase